MRALSLSPEGQASLRTERLPAGDRGPRPGGRLQVPGVPVPRNVLCLLSPYANPNFLQLLPLGTPQGLPPQGPQVPTSCEPLFPRGPSLQEKPRSLPVFPSRLIRSQRTGHPAWARFRLLSLSRAAPPVPGGRPHRLRDQARDGIHGPSVWASPLLLTRLCQGPRGGSDKRSIPKSPQEFLNRERGCPPALVHPPPPRTPSRTPSRILSLQAPTGSCWWPSGALGPILEAPEGNQAREDTASHAFLAEMRKTPPLASVRSTYTPPGRGPLGPSAPAPSAFPLGSSHPTQCLGLARHSWHSALPRRRDHGSRGTRRKLHACGSQGPRSRLTCRGSRLFNTKVPSSTRNEAGGRRALGGQGAPSLCGERHRGPTHTPPPSTQGCSPESG